MIYKLQLLITTTDDPDEPNEKNEWVDLYFDVGNIIGFRVLESKYTKYQDQASFIYIKGDAFLIKSEPHIMKFLLENFVDKAIEAHEVI